MNQQKSAGLCELCRHARRVTSAKHSIFWLCERSRTDHRFAKYPPLPVLDCLGYEQGKPHGGAGPKTQT